MDESKLIAELTVAEFKALFLECMQTYRHGQEIGTAQQQAAGTREYTLGYAGYDALRFAFDKLKR